MATKKKSTRSVRKSAARPPKASGMQSNAVGEVRIEAPVRGAGRGGYVVKFGTVTIKGAKPDAAMISRNVIRGADAFTRAVTKMASAGVTLEAAPDVPTFRAAPDNPKVLIRRLNGKEQRGHMRHGKFVVAE